MEPSRFHKLLEDINTVQAQDLPALNKLSEQYPYFQNLHLLIAKAHQSTNSEGLKVALNKAAIYGVDRAHLKQVMSGEYKFTEIIRIQEIPPVAGEKPPHQKVALPKAAKVKPDSAKATPKETPVATQAPKTVPPAPPAPKEVAPKQRSPKPATTTGSSTPDPSKADTSKSDVYQELDNNLKQLSERKKAMLAFLEGDTISGKKKPTVPKKRLPKKENQIELIEKFIKNEPQMGKKAVETDESQPLQEDLATKKLKYSERFQTETYAQLLIKQKKYAKAVSIYENLMLKFPKKTAYFASQIEKINQRANV